MFFLGFHILLVYIRAIYMGQWGCRGCEKPDSVLCRIDTGMIKFVSRQGILMELILT